jgi:hypothetical protein
MKLLFPLLPLLLLVGCTSAPVLYEGGGIDEAALKDIKSVQVKPIVYDVQLPVDSEVGMGEFKQATPEFEKEFLTRLQESEPRPFSVDNGETVLEVTVQLVDFGESSAFKSRPGRITGALTLSRNGQVLYSANFQGQVATGISTWRSRVAAAHRDVARALAERIGNTYP